MRGGALLGGDHINVQAVMTLEQQVKRVMGADPALDLNVSSLRDRADPELLRILLLAVLGNFTSAAGSEWNQPCRLAVDPQTGLVALLDPQPVGSVALKVVVILLVAVEMRRKMAESMQQQQQTQKSTGRGEPSNASTKQHTV